MNDKNSFDNFALDLFRTCPRKYFWRIEKGYTPREPSPPLLWGQMWHLALQSYYEMKMKNGDPEVAHDVAISLVQEKYDSVCRPWDDKRRTKDMLLKALDAYIQLFGNEPYKPSQVEVGFAIELARTIYTGRIDLILVDVNGSPIVVDFKHTSMYIGSAYLKQFELDNQITGYSLACMELMGLKNPPDCILRIAGLSQKDVLTKGPLIVGQMVARGHKQIVEFKQDVFMLARNINNCMIEEVWPKYTISCTKWNTICPYFDLCWLGLDKEDAEKIFDVSFWEPYKEEV